jgi:hypothetical protein
VKSPVLAGVAVEVDAQIACEEVGMMYLVASQVLGKGRDFLLRGRPEEGAVSSGKMVRHRGIVARRLAKGEPTKEGVARSRVELVKVAVFSLD